MSAGTTANSAQMESPDRQKSVDMLTINGDAITVDQVLTPLRSDLSEKAASMSPPRYRDYLVDTLRERIRVMARDLLLYQEASQRLTEQENEYLDKFTDQKVREIVQQEYNGRQVRWEQALAANGTSPEETRARIRRELVIMRHLQQTVTPRIGEPTRRELMRYFEQTKQEMTSAERREMFLIEIPAGDDPTAARRLAEQIQSELNGGADFAELAAQYSKGIHASDGGSWGMVEPGSLRGKWAQAGEALMELTTSGTSRIVDVGESLFIVRVGKIEPSREPNFSEVQVQLTKAYKDHQFNLLVEELVGKLQERAIIEPDNLNLFLQAAVDTSP